MIKLLDEIFLSLTNWGDHPAFIEVSSQNPAIYTTAQQFKERILDSANFLKIGAKAEDYLRPISSAKAG